MVLLLGTTVAVAQKKRRPEGTVFFEIGRKFFAEEKYDEAIAAYKKAYKLLKHRSVLFNIALAYGFKRDWVQAGAYARKYLKKARGRERRLPSILKKAVRRTGVLIVETPNPKAAIHVDGRKVGRGRIEIVTRAGKHTVEILLGDRRLTRKQVKVPRRGRTTWKVPITGPDPQPRPTPRPHPPTKSPSRKKLHWVYFTVAAVVAAAAVGSAVYLTIKTEQIYEDFVNTNRTDRSLRNQGRTYEASRNGLWGVAGGAIAGAVVLAVFTRWSRREKEKETISIRPTVAPDRYGLTLRLGF
jgi:tetratricopeptide (TPR) repeat protein